jgi:ribonuclease VapC
MSTSVANTCAVDTSAIVAICFQEPGFEIYRSALAAYDAVFMSASTRLELGIVSTQREIVGLVQEILKTYQIQIVSFDEQQSLLAVAAFERYGKGRHPAALNFGDCCSYALAVSRQLPLLFKGDDFAKTDVKNALLQQN